MKHRRKSRVKGRQRKTLLLVLFLWEEAGSSYKESKAREEECEE